MNETAPVQKQDMDRVRGLLEAILAELKAIRQVLPPPADPSAGRP